MFTATQAKNIADEHNNHIYYRYYRKYTKKIMTGITRAIKQGEHTFSYMVRYAVRPQLMCMRQIGKELEDYGYRVEIEVNPHNGDKYDNDIVVNIGWAVSD